MMAAYIITRMVDMLTQATTKNLTKVFGFITIIVTLVAVVDILNAGSSLVVPTCRR